MANAKPYLTTNALMDSIKARISFPLSQSTFTYNDVVRFINEELQLSAVPSIKEEHEEYFVFKAPPVALVNGISRYGIPNRAMGMTVRDINWSDSSGNFFKMSRIAPEDKSFFQQNVGSNQAIGKYYIEGNEIVLTPQVSTGATGSLNFFIFLRVNQMVRDDRACIIQNFVKGLEISNNSTVVANDTITIITGNESSVTTETVLTAVSGSPATVYEFQIGATAQITASNLTNVINSLSLEDVSATYSSITSTLSYDDISTTFTTTSDGITIDNNYLYIKFDQLPTTYTDPDTNVTDDFFSVNSKCDFLQTNPGHKTFTYDIKLRAIESGNIGKFKVTDMQTYLNNSSGGNLEFFPIEVGDYMCIANECIIPQIPPELHNALAERAASRILMAIGDKDGYAISQQKISEMDKQQATLIGQRVEGSVPKVFNTFSLLRLGKKGRRRI